MGRTVRMALTVLAFAFLGGAVLGGEDAEQGRREKMRVRAKEMARKMEKFRGLKLKQEVEVGVKTEKELLAFLKKSIDEELPDKKIVGIQRAYIKMGLLPAGIDLKKTFLDMLTSQVGGFYNPKTKKLFLIDRRGKKGANPQGGMMEAGLKMLGLSMDDIVTAHELTHALQDQHFDLQRLEKSVADNDDRLLALKCVFEGDATIAMNEPIIEKIPMARGMLDRIENMDAMGMPMGKEMESVPAILKVPLAYPYIGGAKLVGRAKKKGGWKAVDRMYADLPQSSEQVLHPEKYFGDRDDPTFIRFRQPKTLAPDGWEQLESNSLGEIGLQILLDEFLSKSEAKAGAAGWDGDRFGAYGKGEDVFFYAYSTWDDEEEAREFARVYVKALRKKLGLGKGKRAKEAGGEINFVFMKDGEHGRVLTRGRDVVIVEGLDADEASALIERLFDRVKKHGPSEPLPGPPPADGEAEVRGEGFTLRPPPGWEVRREDKYSRIVLEAPKGRARIEVGVLPLRERSTPEEVGKKLQRSLPDRLDRYRLLGAETGTRGDREAYLLRFEGEDPASGALFRYFMVVLTRGRRAVVSTVAAPIREYEETSRAARKVMRSFRMD